LHTICSAVDLPVLLLDEKSTGHSLYVFHAKSFTSSCLANILNFISGEKILFEKEILPGICAQLSRFRKVICKIANSTSF
jgi:hypothetical protein